MKKKHVLTLFVLFLTLSGKADISQVPEKDIRNIKSLFSFLLIEHDFGYPIFGSKPMALADFCLEASPREPAHQLLNAQLYYAKKRGWLNSWYKYKKELVFKDFIFLDQEDFGYPVLILINKKNLLNVLKEHELVFKQVLGDSFAPESFLEKIEKKEVPFAEAVRRSQALLGIMLGYGERNAMLFQEKMRLYWKKKQLKGVLKKDSELHKKYQESDSKLQCFNELEEFAAIMPLYFASDNMHPETTALRKKYKEDQLKIVELMSQPNFMDRVLERLIQ